MPGTSHLTTDDNMYMSGLHHGHYNKAKELHLSIVYSNSFGHTVHHQYAIIGQKVEDLQSH